LTDGCRDEDELVVDDGDDRQLEQEVYRDEQDDGGDQDIGTDHVNGEKEDVNSNGGAEDKARDCWDRSDSANQNGSETVQSHAGGTSQDVGTLIDQNEAEAGTSLHTNTACEAKSPLECGTSTSHFGAEVTFDSDDGGGDQMLLERDGKFHVVNTDDVIAEDDGPRSRSSSSSSEEAALRVSSLSVKTSSGGSQGRRSVLRVSSFTSQSMSRILVFSYLFLCEDGLSGDLLDRDFHYAMDSGCITHFYHTLYEWRLVSFLLH